MRLASLSLLLAASILPACAGDDPPPGDSRLPLSACAAEGRPLAQTWSVDNGHGAVQALAVAPSGDVALAGADGSIKLWRVDTGDKAWSQEGDPGAAYGNEFGEGAVTRVLAFLDDGASLVAATSTGELRLHDAATGDLLGSLAYNAVTCSALMPLPQGGVLVADEGFGGNLSVWSPESGTLTPLAHEDAELPYTLWGVNALLATPARVVAGGDWYGIAGVELWTADEVPALTATWMGENVAALASGTEILAMALSADGAHLVAGGQDVNGAGTGFLVRLDVAKLAAGEDPVDAVVSLPGHAVRALVLEGDAIVTTGADGTLRLFDATTLAESSRVEMTGGPLAATDDGLRAITAGADGVLRLWGCDAE